jgi:predicted MFS family arabinose efflux permease
MALTALDILRLQDDPMSQPQLTRHSIAVLIVGFIVLFVGGGSRFAIGLVLKPMAEDLGWNRSTLGFAVAAFLVVSAICMFLSGRLSDRFSQRAVLASGLLIAAMGIGAMSLVVEPWQALALYGGVFAIGNGIASIAPVGVMVTRWFPGRAGIANAITTSGIGVGQLVIISALAAVLVSIGWRSVYIWLGIVNLALVPVVFLAISARSQDTAPTTQSKAPAEGMTVREAMRTRHFWLLTMVYAICGFQDFFVATHVVAFAQDRGIEALFAGNLLALMGLAGVIGVIAAGLWSDRSGPGKATLFCFLLRIAIFGLIVTDQNTTSIAVFALLYGTTFWLTAPLTVIFARSAFGLAHLGAISGLIVMVHHMCGGLGAWLGAALFDIQGSYDIAFMLMLALSVIATAIAFMVRNTGRTI